MVHGVPIKSAEELKLARQAGKLAADVLNIVEAFVVPGVSTEALDRI
jgi:methionyl aminopeptidase